MGWVSPTGHNDPQNAWSNETNAYDENTGSFASGWHFSEAPYLELTLTSPISCDKVQVYVGTFSNSDVSIYVYYSDAWHSIFSGTIAKNQWVEKEIGSTQTVSKAKFQGNLSGTSYWLCEFDFNEVEAAGYYHGLKVQGVGELALCDVGTHPLRIRKGDTTYGIELVPTTDSNASAIRIKTPAGIKAIRKYT